MPAMSISHVAVEISIAFRMLLALPTAVGLMSWLTLSLATSTAGATTGTAS